LAFVRCRYSPRVLTCLSTLRATALNLACYFFAVGLAGAAAGRSPTTEIRRMMIGVAGAEAPNGP
jgi:hypothetical protein